MYTRYFGLTEKPFAISPNPRYLFMSELHREALAHLLYGINSDGCFILLTGEVGTGKTTVCRCLLTQLPEYTDVAIILNPKLTARDLLKTICEELEILPVGNIATMKTYIDVLNRHLLASHAKGRTTAVIIDEAQNLDINVLEQLRLLTNLETDTQKLLQIILVGQPELRDILNKPQLSQLNQRITSRYHLTSLNPDDIHTYIHHRVRIAGGENRKLFSDKAIKHIAKLTKGIPRLINVLCDRALLGAYAENADHVSLKIVRQAGLEVFPQNTLRNLLLNGRFIGAAAALVILVAIAIILSSPLFETVPPPAEITTAKTTPLKNTGPAERTAPREDIVQQVEQEQSAGVVAQVNGETTVEIAPETPETQSTIQISPPRHLSKLKDDPNTLLSEPHESKQ